MSKEDKNFERPSDVRRYALALAVAWTILIVAFLVWNAHQEIKNTLDIVRTEAVTHLLKEQAFHYWGASHGGVYVPPDEHTPANPHLSHIPERDLVTDTGKKLTLMNPAYMARQMM